VFPPEVGGSGRWLWELYSRLPRDEYVVVANVNPGAAEFDRTHNLRIVRLPLEFRSWGALGWRSGNAYLGLYRRLRRIAAEKAVARVHAACILPEGFLAWMLRQRLQIPYLVYIHGEELNVVRQSHELTWMSKRVLADASQIIANSDNTASLLQSTWSVPLARIHVMRPGVDTNKYRPMPRDEAARHDLGWDNRPVVLTVGRLQPRKGQDLFVRALPEIRSRIPDILYAIVGDGRERDRLARLVDELHLAEQVVMHGELADRDLVKAFQQCDLFALPNRTECGDIEGFGMVLLEAQACGKPVLTGDSGGTREAIRSGETGIVVDCTSASNIAAETNRLLSDCTHLASMGRRGRDWVCAKFDWEVCVAEARRVFDASALERKLVAVEDR
jgi:phosphatidyl-myo-inositol dimannoside synthase